MRLLLLLLGSVVWVFLGACVMAYANYRVEEAGLARASDTRGAAIMVFLWPVVLLFIVLTKAGVIGRDGH